MISVVPATMQHAEQMAPCMSAADVAEIEAMGFTPREALIYSLQGSTVADCALLDAAPVALWGLCPRGLLGDRALLWMLGTPAVQQHAKALLALSRYFAEWAQARYPVLECLIDSRHDKAIRWVRWLGFRPTGGTVTMRGVEFVGFERGARHGA